MNDKKIHFVTSFNYLGSIISYDLDDTKDIKKRIDKASSAMGALNFIWNAEEISLRTKIKLTIKSN